MLTPQLLDPVWRRVLAVAALAGALPADVDPGVRWVRPCWSHVDPVKDVQSDVLAVEAGFKSQPAGRRRVGPADPDQVAAETRRRRGQPA